MQHDLLITGFGAFPGVARNPSARLVEALAREKRFSRLGWRVEICVLKVGYANVAAYFAREAEYPPRAVLMFGVAAKSKRVRIELRAINRVSISAKDATRALPGDARLEGCADVFRRARAPLGAALRAMRQAGVGADYSRSAGRYVCNAAYWRALRAMPPQTLVLFVHIPMLMQPGMKKRDPRPEFARLLMGAKGVARAMLMAARTRL